MLYVWFIYIHACEPNYWVYLLGPYKLKSVGKEQKALQILARRREEKMGLQ